MGRLVPRGRLRLRAPPWDAKDLPAVPPGLQDGAQGSEQEGPGRGVRVCIRPQGAAGPGPEQRGGCVRPAPRLRVLRV